MGRNYVSFDRKAAEARVRAEQKRRERDRLKTEEAAIWDQLVAEQREATRSRSTRQEQPKTKQRKRRPSATEEGERALKQAIVLLDDYAETEAKIVIHFIKTFPDSQHVARVLAVSRYQGFVSPPDANHPQLLALMNRAKRFLGEDAVDRHVRTMQARLRQTARTLLREGTPEVRKRTLEALRDVRAEMRMAREEDVISRSSSIAKGAAAISLASHCRLITIGRNKIRDAGGGYRAGRRVEHQNPNCRTLFVSRSAGTILSRHLAGDEVLP